MKEQISDHDDIEKRLAIFFGLGAFILSALVGLLRGYTLEGFLIQGILVLIVACLVGYLFGAWLRSTLRATEPEEQALAANVERRSGVSEHLDMSTPVTPSQTEAVIAEEEGSPSGRIINFSLPELAPDAAQAEEAAAKL